MPSRESVTVEQAIRRGQLLINFPAMFLMFGTIFGSILSLGIVTRIFGKGDFVVAWAFGGFIIGFVLGGIWWSFMVPRWRIWAYERVNDIPTLKRRAVQAQLVWPEGHFFAKLEFTSRAQAERLRELESGQLAAPSDDAAAVHYAPSGENFGMPILFVKGWRWRVVWLAGSGLLLGLFLAGRRTVESGGVDALLTARGAFVTVFAALTVAIWFTLTMLMVVVIAAFAWKQRANLIAKLRTRGTNEVVIFSVDMLFHIGVAVTAPLLFILSGRLVAALR